MLMKKQIIKLLTPVMMLALAHPALAVTLTDPLGGASIPTIIGRIIKAALGVSGSLALIMFIYGGFIWMTSGGDKEKITKGRKTLVWAVLGLVIVFTAYILVDVVLTALTSGDVAA